MAKLESSFKNMFVVLTLIAIIAAGALTAVYLQTKETIALAKQAKTEQAIKDVLPEYTTLDEAVEVEGCQVHKAYDANGNLVGAAVEAENPNGFGGAIKLMLGFDKDGNVVNYSVLDQKETPGLGTKMVEWFKEGQKGCIVGKNPSVDNFTVSKDGGDIDAITASTISSRAFLGGVKTAFNAFLQATGKIVEEKSEIAEADATSSATVAAKSDTCENVAKTNAAINKADATSSATVATPKTAQEPESVAVSSSTTKEQIVKDIIAGKLGNGIERRNAVKAAGFDCDEVQEAVNEIIIKEE